jgi:hypothetical protein
MVVTVSASSFLSKGHTLEDTFIVVEGKRIKVYCVQCFPVDGRESEFPQSFVLQFATTPDMKEPITLETSDLDFTYAIGQCHEQTVQQNPKPSKT